MINEIGEQSVYHKDYLADGLIIPISSASETFFLMQKSTNAIKKIRPLVSGDGEFAHVPVKSVCSPGVYLLVNEATLLSFMGDQAEGDIDCNETDNSLVAEYLVEGSDLHLAVFKNGDLYYIISYTSPEEFSVFCSAAKARPLLLSATGDGLEIAIRAEFHLNQALEIDQFGICLTTVDGIQTLVPARDATPTETDRSRQNRTVADIVITNQDFSAAYNRVSACNVSFYARTKTGVTIFWSPSILVASFADAPTLMFEGGQKIALETRNNKYLPTLVIAPKSGNRIEVCDVLKIRKLGKNRLRVEGVLAIPGIKHSNDASIHLEFKQRFGEAVVNIPVRHSMSRIINDVLPKRGRKNYLRLRYISDISVQSIFPLFMENRFVDIFLCININGARYRTKMYIRGNRFESLEGEDVVRFKRIYEGNDVTFYVTRASRQLACMFREWLPEDRFVARVKEEAARITNCVLPKRTKSLWLMYETYSVTAQDNSYYFFKWLRKNVPQREVYYIIRKDSPDLDMLKGYMNKVVFYYSFKHLLLMLRATLFVSSQGRYHAFKFRPTRSKYKTLVLSKKLVFLQHGVTAFKRSTFKKQDASGGASLVMSVSPREHDIIVNNWGYRDKEVPIVGFSRFDELVDCSSEQESKIILVMPTWRNWLEGQSMAVFRDSAFYKNYRDLLVRLTAEFPDKRIQFYTHIKMREFGSDLVNGIERVEFAGVGEEKVNTLLMKARYLITDYSSVAWDFVYMAKPVIFFQFDSERYQKEVGSFIDFSSELPGSRCYSAQAIIDALVADDVPALDPGNFFKYNDKRNNHRIYRHILEKFGPDV